MSTPLPIPAVPDTERYVAYVIGGTATSVVDVPFPVYGDETDLKVLVDGTQIDSSTYGIASKSGLSVDTLPRPLTDAQIVFSSPIVPQVLEIFGDIRPRWTSMGAASGIARREFNQFVGYVISALREIWHTVANLAAPAMIPDARGTLTGRATYDGAAAGFVYQVLDDPADRIIFYVKLSASSGDWSTPQVGTGPQGPAGANGSNGLNGSSTSFKNRVINGRFQVNERSYVSGAALSAGAYAHDRWKAGSGGGSYTHAGSAAGTQISITSGTLVQIVEDANIEGGTYTLSWVGTAQGRVNGGSYAASPIVTTGLAASANITLEFSTGTLGQVQLEPGSTATAYEQRPISFEIEACLRYARWVPFNWTTYFPAGGLEFQMQVELSPPMRVAPSIGSVVIDPESAGSVTTNLASASVGAGTKHGVTLRMTASAAGATIVAGYRALLEAEL